MTTFLLASVETCAGRHGLCHHLREKRGSVLLVLRGSMTMTMIIFLPSSVESCEGGHGLCHGHTPFHLRTRRPDLASLEDMP